MDLLASSPGMMAALQLWRSLLRYNSPAQLVQSCGTFEHVFSRGSCAFTVSRLISWLVGWLVGPALPQGSCKFTMIWILC